MDSTIPSADIEPNSWKNQLRYWSIHCCLTALPSFLLALIHFKYVSNIIAMLSGIATFVIAYTIITSAPGYGKLHTGLIGRSIRLGAKIRMIISLVGLPLAIIQLAVYQGGHDVSVMFFTADFWFGYAAIFIVIFGGDIVGLHVNILSDSGVANDFLGTYIVTIVEGILISVSLVMIAFFSLLIFNHRAKKASIAKHHSA